MARPEVHGEIAVAGKGGESVYEIWLALSGSGSGSQRSWLGVVSTSLKGTSDEAVGDALVGLVHDRWTDAVGPGAAVEQAGRGEGLPLSCSV